MAKLDMTYTADEMPKNERSGDFSPLPAGWYTARITAAEIKETNARTGQYIKIRYDIVGPTHQGRVVFGNLNIKNPNPKAEEIGRQQLGDLMRAVGMARVSDTDELIGKVLVIKLKVREAQGEYAASNDVSGFKATDGSNLPAPNAAGAPAAGGGSKAPPWKR